MVTKKPTKGKGTSKKKVRRLSVRAEKLVEGVLQGKSKRRAALDAGYSQNTANVKVYEMLEKDSIQARIQERIKESQIDTKEIIGTLVSHMRGDLADIVPKDKFLAEARQNGVSHLIKELEITERTILGEEDEDSILERKYKIKIHDSQSAAKSLATIHGLEKAKETHPNDVERAEVNKRESLKAWLQEQGILQSDTVQ